MIIESLPIKIFEENFSNFEKCKDKWKTDNFVDEKFVEDAMKDTIEIIKMTEPKESTARWEWINAKSMLERGHLVSDPLAFYRIKSDSPRCPRCGGTYEVESMNYSLSRRDNSTRICSDCGTTEAFEDFLGTR